MTRALNLIPATPRTLTDPPPPVKPEKTMTRWTQFLGSVATGMALQDAMLKHFMTRADIEACVRLGIEERQRWNDARVAGKKSKFSAFDIEDILSRIARGCTIGDACQAVRPGLQSEFVEICTQDPELNELYLRACKSRSFIESEKILDIADDKTDDVLDNGKVLVPNQANVNRDKLRVETRARLMAAWNTRVFGENKHNVQVNVQVNHAEKLEQARARAKTKTVTRRQEATLEAEFKELPPPVEVALDTSWLEG
jgi:hypothetical protein